MGEDVEVVLIQQPGPLDQPWDRPLDVRLIPNAMGQGEEPESAPYELTEDRGNWDDPTFSMGNSTINGHFQ